MFSGVAFYQSAESASAGLTYGRFVGVRRADTNLRAAWSNDGITWNTATTPNSLNYYCVDFSPEQGLYVATSIDASTSNIMSSTNGVTWTSRSKPDSLAVNSITWCVAFSKWIATGPTKFYVSPDGATWSIGYTISDTNYNSHAYESLFVNSLTGPIWATPLNDAPGVDTQRAMKIAYTTDGTTFTETVINGEIIWYNNDGRSINYLADQNRYLITNQSTVTKMLTATAIVASWSAYTQSVFPSGAIRFNPAAGAKVFVSTNFSGGTTTTPIQYSSLGTNGSWTSSTFASAVYDFYDTEWSPEISLFYAARVSGNGYTSPDGITWTLRTAPASITHVSWGAGVRTTGYKQGSGIT